MSKTVLAFDIGASSGRAILSTIEDGKMVLQEVHRFPNDPVCVNGTLYWDILRIFHEIKQGIKKAVNEVRNGHIDSMGIDTWGVDFGFINKEGKLSDNPVHYRDERTNGAIEEIEKSISREELYRKTGIQFMFSNSLYQIVGLKRQNTNAFINAEKFLMIPDLIINFLTGSTACDVTAASTTQMYNPENGIWCEDVLERLKIPTYFLPELVQPGTYRGKIKSEICMEMNIPHIPVYTVAEHDTASALVAVPYRKNEKAACISCGTASIIGVECAKPFLSGKSFEYNFTNEAGYSGTVRLMKNILGMWLINESRRWWEKADRLYSFEELSSLANAAEPFKCIVNPDDDSFVAPGNLPERIADFCEKTGQPRPETVGETVRCIYESLALKHAIRLNMLSEITGTDYDTVHIVGGGSKNTLFCSMLASACGCKVVAGPGEATAIGNCTVQFISLGEIKDLAEARTLIVNSCDINVYDPVDTEIWKNVYSKYYDILV